MPTINNVNVPTTGNVIGVSRAELELLQANIIKSHGRDHATHLFFDAKGADVEALREWIKKLRITDAATQLDDTDTYKDLLGKKKSGATTPEDERHLTDLTKKSLRCIYFTATGLRQLGEAPPPDMDAAFLAGMKARQRKLEDPAAARWEFSKAKEQDISFMLLVANSDINMLAAEVGTLLGNLPAGVLLLHRQEGEVLKNEHGIGIEHFGYADGVSQPTFFTTDPTGIFWTDKVPPKAMCLVQDPLSNNPDALGSYFVFRKLEQNVAGFKEAEEDLGLGELAGAYAVGRFEDGTVVTKHGEEQHITSEKQLENDFNYQVDQEGSRCPFHAHIRLTNPRLHPNAANPADNIRVVRRGMPYDEANRRGRLEWHPTEKVGLLFMCFQQSIEGQFEVMQAHWANNGNVSGSGHFAIDPLIGQGNNKRQQEYPLEWNSDRKMIGCNIKGFVTLKGGDYFFAPSIAFINQL